MKLFDILTNFGIMETTLAMIIGLTCRDFIYDLADEFLVPILLIFLGIKTINDIKFTYHGTTMRIGYILIGLVRTILITVLVMALIYPVTEEIINRKNETNKKIICELEKINGGTRKLEKQLLKIKSEFAEQVSPNILM
jgi:large-conductance mechanosensitive channel